MPVNSVKFVTQAKRKSFCLPSAFCSRTLPCRKSAGKGRTKIPKQFEYTEKTYYLCRSFRKRERRDGRVVDCGGLENR